MNTEAINHDPAITYINTGTQQFGHPSMGAWLAYGLGSLSDNLPAYVTMISVGKKPGQALYARLWGSGFLPSQYQGVQFRSGKDAVLYLNDPDGIDRDLRRSHARRTRKPESPAVPNRSGSRNRSSHFPIRDGFPHAVVRPRPYGHLSRARSRF
jgi:hypothetical protein